MQSTRPTAVAGLFYPADPAELATAVEGLLKTAPMPPGDQWPKALIAPHAGYIYSGPTAAIAYARLQPAREVIRRVVLLGPCHRVGVRGLALPGVAALASPLGAIPVDSAAVDAIVDLPQVVTAPAVHAMEHSLEVHLPFLQAVLDDFAVVPLAVGNASAEEVAAVLERLWGGPETLIVVSSDLSHFHAYDEAVAIDGGTCRQILDFSDGIDHEQACGATPIGGLLRVARRRGLRAELLDMRNSGDTAGDRHRVVGYAAFAFHEGAPAEARHD